MDTRNLNEQADQQTTGEQPFGEPGMGEQQTAGKKFHTEELQVKGEEIVSKVKELVHQGNIRHIVIKNEDGKTIMELPFILGVAGVLLVPQLAAVGAVAALLSRASIIIEKTED